MKTRNLRFPLLAILAALLLLVTSCSSTEPAEPAVDETVVQLQEQIRSDVTAALEYSVPVQSVVVTTSDAGNTVTVHIADDADIAFFGNYVVDVYENCIENDATEDTFVVTQAIDGSADAILLFLYSGVDFMFGHLSDNRSGETVTTKYTTVDDLAKDFPALSTAAAEAAIDPADMTMYEEIMEVLESNLDKSEEELLTELAPQYARTPEELKAFLDEMLIKIYL